MGVMAPQRDHQRNLNMLIMSRLTLCSALVVLRGQKCVRLPLGVLRIALMETYMVVPEEAMGHIPALDSTV